MTGNTELSTELSKELLLQLGSHQSQDKLMQSYDELEVLREDAIEASGIEEHDEAYEALCRWISIVLNDHLSFDYT